MSARRKKARRLRDVRRLAAAGRLTSKQAAAIADRHGLGPIGDNPGRSRRRRIPAGDWAVHQAELIRTAKEEDA